MSADMERAPGTSRRSQKTPHQKFSLSSVPLSPERQSERDADLRVRAWLMGRT